MADKRNRRTREQMLAYYQEKAAKLVAQIDGSYDESQENDVLKALKRRLRKTETALKAARITLNGIEGKDGKGWTRAPISEKIATTILRLSQQRVAQDRAEEQIAVLPCDVNQLSALIGASEAGDVVDFPTDLHSLSLKEEEEKCDEEFEAEFIAEEN